jgi:hypothetical protein
VWLLTLPLAIIGSQLAHALAYRLVTPNESERAHELAASGHAYLAYAPAVLGLCSVLVVVALAGELRRLVGDRQRWPSSPSPSSFALLAPAIFFCQEHFERLLHNGAFPWDAMLQPPLLVGLLFQLPFAFATYLVARLLLRVVRTLSRLLGASLPRRALAFAALKPQLHVLAPRIPVLARGYGSRAPPT